MIRNIFISLVVTTIAATASAGEKPVAVALLDRNVYHRPFRSLPLPSVTESYEYYEVRGSSEKELRSNLTRSSTMANDGRRYDAFTSWSWKWEFGPVEDDMPGQCGHRPVHVSVEVTYHIPRWVHDEGVPRQLVDKWDEYLKQLIAHEEGHADLAVQAATDLSREAANLPAAGTCKEADKAVLALSRKLMKELSADQVRYDAETRHGVLQGALFP